MRPDPLLGVGLLVIGAFAALAVAGAVVFVRVVA